MATPAMTPPPMPGGGAGPTPDPQAAGVVSPAPPQGNPSQQAGVDDMIKATRMLVAIAEQFPTAAATFGQIKPLLAQMTSDIMEDMQAPEPAAPPQA